jgi:diguanylate cyclase (GGDEF)-like protein
MPVNGRPWQEAPTGLRTALPYLPVAAAFGVAGVLQPRGQIDGVLLTALLLIAVLILVRQFLALRSNARLLAEVEAQREMLAHQATHDHLTGLANRKLLHARTAEAVERDDPVALLIIDLDGFKQVNDGYGHAAGDEMLVRVADVLRAVTPPGMTAARLGGDEFAILLNPATDAEAAMAVADNVIARVAASDSRIGASVGVAFEPAGRTTLSALLSDADAALYRAKAAGKGIAEAAGKGIATAAGVA